MPLREKLAPETKRGLRPLTHRYRDLSNRGHKGGDGLNQQDDVGGGHGSSLSRTACAIRGAQPPALAHRTRPPAATRDEAARRKQIAFSGSSGRLNRPRNSTLPVHGGTCAPPALSGSALAKKLTRINQILAIGSIYSGLSNPSADRVSVVTLQSRKRRPPTSEVRSRIAPNCSHGSLPLNPT